MSKPEVLVVILNWNGKEVLEDCLDSILANTEYPENRHNVVVADNGSEDGSEDMAEEKGYEVQRNERNLGFDIANNKAIYKNPGYDYYVLLNNDTEFKSGWLKALVELAETCDKPAMIGPKILNEDGTIQSAGYTAPLLEPMHRGERAEEVEEPFEAGAVHGCAMMISSELIQEVGYLDEIFTPGNAEEWDYCSRVRSAGYKIKVAPGSEVIHKEDMTKKNMQSWKPYFMDRKNKLKHELMNGSPRMVGRELFQSIKHFGASIIGYMYNPFIPLLKAHMEVLRDLPVIMRKRKKPDRYVPPYYCEGIKDYSRRYDWMD